MRFRSDSVNGIQVFAVTGTNTVSFSIHATAAARTGLLGFSVERHDPQAGEKRFLRGYKVFKALVPDPKENLDVSTFVHPIQSFVWDDFTAKPGHRYVYGFYPFRGTAKVPKRDAPIELEIDTEPLYAPNQPHDVFFNRGVASSQAYYHKFKNKRPDKQPTPELQAEAWSWLTRDLKGALLKFIDDAKHGDQLLCAFYELKYRPVVEALLTAIGRGVDVQLVIDAKKNEHVDSKTGELVESEPREPNLRLLAAVQFPMDRVTLRETRPGVLQHNKFMVLRRGATRTAIAVWTGSTNMTESGLFGQTNVGHWVRDGAVAQAFADYWALLATDPGGEGNSGPAKAKNAKYRKDVEAIAPTFDPTTKIQPGVAPVFSPRSKLATLEMYAKLIDEAKPLGCITFPFVIGKEFKAVLENNTPQLDGLLLMLLDKQDRPAKPKPGSPKPAFVSLNASKNIYKAWGEYLDEPVHQWVRETNTRALRLSRNVAYVHTKFMLLDPLGKEPIVITGSANFSSASTKDNDENMLIICGDLRVADIYYTEFNRIFNHYYYRAVQKSVTTGDSDPDANIFLDEDGKWLAKYGPGTFRTKKLAALKGMHVP